MSSAFYKELDSGIGGSSVPILLGDPAHLKYTSPFQLWQTMTGQLERTEPPRFDPAWMGKFMEPSLRNLLSLDTGLSVQAPWEVHVDPVLGFETTMLRDDEIPFMICHLDGWAWSKDAVAGKTPRFIVEAKNMGEYKRSEFGKEYTDEVPDALIYQCIHNLRVARSFCTAQKLPLPDKALCPVIVGGNKYRTYVIEWHADLAANLYPIENEFWQLVVNRIPPPIDGSEATMKFIKEKYRTANPDTSIIATPEIVQAVIARQRAVEAAKEIEVAQNEAENQIRAFLGETESLMFEGNTLATYKSYDGKVSHKDIADELLNEIAKIRKWSPEYRAKKWAELEADHRGLGYREFYFKKKYIALLEGEQL